MSTDYVIALFTSKTLFAQVCSTLVTLAVKISRDDLLTLGEVLTEHGHSLITYMDACRTHLKGQQITCLCRQTNKFIWLNIIVHIWIMIWQSKPILKTSLVTGVYVIEKIFQ